MRAKYLNLFIGIVCMSLLPMYQAVSQTCTEIGLINAKSVEYTTNTGAKLTYTIKTEGDRMYSIYNGSGIEIKSYSRCQHDTLLVYKGGCPEYIVKDNDTIGMAFYGVDKIPLNMQVGDTLLSSIDYTTFGYSKKDEQEAPRVSAYIWGDYIYFPTTIHKAEVNTRFRNGTVTINKVNAIVTAKEFFTLQGKEYTVYKIASEIWTKSSLTTSTSSSDKVVSKQAAKNARKFNKNMEKTTQALGDNAQGYKITPVDMWFAPQLGTYVKIIYYDSQKVLMTFKMELTSVQ